MKYILCFIGNDEENVIEYIQESRNRIETSGVDFRVVVQNTRELSEDQERDKIEFFKQKYSSMSNEFIPVPKLKDDKEVSMTYSNLFINLIKGEESTEQTTSKTCCRI